MIKGRIILAGLITFVGLNGYSQESVSASLDEKATKMTEKMIEEFSLDEASLEELKAINLTFVTSAQEVRSNTELSKEEKQAKMQEIIKVRNESLGEILTDEQIAEFQKREREHFKNRGVLADSDHEGFQHKTPEEKATHRTEKLAQQLDLSDDQKEKVKHLTLKVINKIDVIKADSTMTKERRKEFIEESMKDYKKAMKSILTEEQFEKFEAIAEEKKGKHQPKKEKVTE